MKLIYLLNESVGAEEREKVSYCEDKIGPIYESFLFCLTLSLNKGRSCKKRSERRSDKARKCIHMCVHLREDR